jgi:hypothetical protein
MTAATLTYLIAQEHINDRMRNAEHRRRIAEVRAPGRFRLSLPRVFARRVARTAVA